VEVAAAWSTLALQMVPEESEGEETVVLTTVRLAALARPSLAAAVVVLLAVVARALAATVALEL
jgi:hypothetical protein